MFLLDSKNMYCFLDQARAEATKRSPFFLADPFSIAGKSNELKYVVTLCHHLS
ncbi:MAG: hypothetical protein ACJASL_002819 [Paraglaciecola sp.]|jgi:hypothetical protein